VPEGFEAALDLGCGTGLMGAAIRDRVGDLTGVDLSPGMLTQARAKRHQGRPLYDRLSEGDLMAFLAGEPPGSADLCVAADVLIYVADLAPMLERVARVLRPCGLAAFTVQSHDGEGAILGADGRYAHADSHIIAAASDASLEILLLNGADVRRESGLPVPGRIVVLHRTRR
jgi:predicted TPR repeat methyltransferase